MKDLKNDYLEFITQDKYISKREMNSFLYAKKRDNEYINNCELRQTLKNIDEIVKNHNSNFIERKLIEEKGYFDNIFTGVDDSIKLDEEQRIAILTDEDYSMVIAGAGSGKTTTMAAKVKYLVEKQGINPKEIIMISYTNKAINELKDRINIKYRIPVAIQTFHKLGVTIIKNDQKKISISSDLSLIVKTYFDQMNVEKMSILSRAYTKFFNIKQQEFIDRIIKKNKKIIDIEEMKSDIERENDTNYYLFFIKCVNVIKDMKNKGLDKAYIENKIKNTKNKRSKSFLLLIEDMYKHYQQRLNEIKKIDFDDMINNSCSILKESPNKDYPYKYIIIDEYQDISLQRFNLTREISNLCNAKIIAVGDDWQAIFAFAGSDVQLFTKFKELMGYAAELRISSTYRNSQELIDIAGSFIMKNKEQIRKKLKASKKLKKPVLIYSYQKNLLDALNLAIDELEEEYGNNQKILIIGRYKFDRDKIISDNYFELINEEKIRSIKSPNLDITFLTAHLSKGLGYDNVIILNAEDSKYGFPSKVKDDKLSSIVKTRKEKFKYAEERRLFYVALTRSKNRVYILTPREKESVFIDELRKNPNILYKKIHNNKSKIE